MTAPLIVVGGGIGGLTTALSLLAHGQPCQVHERAPELREIGAGLGLWPAALRVFDQLGIGDDVRALGAPLTPAGIRDVAGRWLVRFHDDEVVEVLGEVPIGVHRGELQALLLSKLPAGVVHTGREFRSLIQADDVEVCFAEGERVAGRGVVGADGNRSAVRSFLFGDRPLHDCGYVGWRGTTAWPGGVDAEEVAGEMWGPEARFGFVPISGDRLTWYGTARRFDTDGGLDDAVRCFERFPSPIPDIVASTPADQLWADRIVDRRPLRRWSCGRVTLLGDAAHPMTPELGQGACQAIIDAWALAEEVGAEKDIASAFRRYEKRRRRRTSFIQLAARGMAAGGNVEHPLAQRLRSTMARTMPNRVALAEFRMVVG